MRSIVNTYTNVNFFLKRPKSFEEKGRIHSLKESIELDTHVWDTIKEQDSIYGKSPFEELYTNDFTVYEIYNTIIKN